MSRVVSDVVVEVPPSTHLWAGGADARPEPLGRVSVRLLEAIDSQAVSATWAIDPPVRKVPLSLTPPTPSIRLSDLARVREALCRALDVEHIRIPIETVRELPQALRSGDWTITATICHFDGGWEVTRIQAGEDVAPPCLAAIDLGTTTVWGQLLDGFTGVVLASAASFNQQIVFGEDVISRMVRAQEAGGRDQLQQAAIATVNEVLEEMAAHAGLAPTSVDYVVVSGNSVMLCLLLGVETRYLRLEPYVPPLDTAPVVKAASLGTGILSAPGAMLKTLPVVGSYVGGDIVAGVVASGMADESGTCLYLDVGTNGEVVIGDRDWLLAASCSAGPAFEGGGLRHGMRATSGAVESVAIDRETLEVSVLTVDDAPPLGICGSGVIDAVAELLRTGLLLANGRFDAEASAPGLRTVGDRLEFVIVPAEFSGTGSDIVLTEADVDNVIRAKAAMFAGVSALLKTVSLDWSDLRRVIIAGAFGRHLRVNEATTIGLLPELDCSRLEFLGNGSLLGARAVALSRDMERKAEGVAAIMNNVELSDNPVFHEEYMAAMFLPHTDMSKFKGVERMLSSLRRQT